MNMETKNDRDEAGPASLPRRRPEPKPEYIDKAGFARRLKIAFDHAINADIARRIGLTDAAIKGYTDGTALPVAETLMNIHRVTGINIHWLLTGEGPERVGRAESLFSEGEEDIVRSLALESGRTFNEQVRVLSLAAIQLKKTIS